MKKNILFILVIGLIFAVMYHTNRNNPSLFVWKPTFDSHDKQPYGAYVFDKILEKSWEDGYIHSYENISELYYYNETLDDKNLLIVCDKFLLDGLEMEYLLEYVENGGTAFIAAGNFDLCLRDTLDFEINTNYSHFALPLNLSLGQVDTSVSFSFLKDSISGIPQSFLRNYFIFSIEDKKRFALLFDAEENPIMIRYPLGEGNLILSSTPLFFTNYSLLNNSINTVIRQSLSYLKGKPLVRTEYYADHVLREKDSSIFRYLLSQPSLRWAYYVAITAGIIFMLFTAKRKQNPIPAIQPPANKMLDFVRSISTLYLMKNNNADIIRKKYIYWSGELRKKYGIDIVNEEHNNAFIKQFSSKTGMPESDARQLFLELDGIRSYTFVSDKEMMDLITKMKIKEW